MVICFFNWGAYGFFRDLEKSYSLRMLHLLGVRLRLTCCRLACGDDANDVVFAPVAMADQEQPKRAAQAQKDETLFVFGMVRVIDQPGTFVEKDGTGLFERDTVLPVVGCGLAFVPLEPKVAHADQCNYIVVTAQRERGKRCLRWLTFDMSGRRRQAKPAVGCP